MTSRSLGVRLLKRFRKESEDCGSSSKIATMTAAANSRLRAVVALGFGGLLALLVYSGSSALHTLRQLHETEETARASSLERRRVLATVVLSANIYTDHIEEVLLSYKIPDAPDVAGETSKKAEAARAALEAYPGDRTPEEQTLCEQLQAFLLEQDSLMRTAGAWTPAGCRGRAQQLVSDENLPRKQRFVNIVQRLELLNDNQAAAANLGATLRYRLPLFVALVCDIQRYHRNRMPG